MRGVFTKDILWPFLASGFAVLLLGGCGSDADTSQALNEKQEPHFQRGQQLLREGRNGEALGAFLKVVDKRRSAPEAHLECGRLLLHHVKDPVASIYHFRKYLEYEPNSVQAPLVRQLIETAHKEFARHLPGKPYADAVDRLDLLELLQQQRQENLALKQRIAILQQELDQTKALPAIELETVAVQSPAVVAEAAMNRRSDQIRAWTAADGADSDSAPKPDFYQVQSGDTLTKISAKIYGNTSRWMDIFQANRDQLGSPHDLQPGQFLHLP